jgi:putative oxidoreductase
MGLFDRIGNLLASIEVFVRRPYSTFARGWPGVGLLVMRLVAGMALIDIGITTLRGGSPIEPAILYALAAVAEILLLAGLWTPIAGALVALVELWAVFSQPGDP